jgi:hypothetical protein
MKRADRADVDALVASGAGLEKFLFDQRPRRARQSLGASGLDQAESGSRYGPGHDDPEYIPAGKRHKTSTIKIIGDSPRTAAENPRSFSKYSLLDPFALRPTGLNPFAEGLVGQGIILQIRACFKKNRQTSGMRLKRDRGGIL